MPNGNWTYFRGHALASGQSQTELSPELELLWKYQVKNGAFEATPLIIEGVCYAPDLDGAIHAVNLADGSTAWTKKTNAFSFAASPAFRDGKLYLGDIDGKFYCFDLTGKELWSFEPKDGGVEISAASTFYQDKVLYGSQDANLYCLDGTKGTLNWKLEVPDQIRCSPTVVDDRCFVAGCDGLLHIIDLAAAKEVASVPIDAPTGVTPAIQGDFLFVGTESGEFFKINWRNPGIEWRLREPRPREIRTSAAVSTTMAVFGSRSKQAYGIDPTTGKEVWSFRCRRSVESSPVIAGEHVVVASTDGRIYLLDLMTGKEIWKKETGDSFSGAPAVVDGKLLLASNDGVLYCFGEKK